jgi:hypothetical protein
MLSSDIASYLQALHSLAKQNNIQKNTPIIDLTNSTPGIAYALDGYTPNVPWVATSYPNDDTYINYVLDGFTCEQIADSLIIVGHGFGIGPIDPKVLNRYGVNFPNDYELIGKIPRYYYYHYLENIRDLTTHEFYKLKIDKESAIQACESSKARIASGN